MSATTDVKQGIREHLGQFSLHVLLVFATGLTIGSERTVVPALGEDVLGVESFLVIGSFVVSFGVVKSILNLYAGKWGEEYGRRPVLVAGWVTALPLPVILIFAPSWGWITVGNVLLGINQALTWSMAINAKIDLASPDERGLAVGIDESFGYTGVAVGAWVTGVIASRWSLRPEPFYFLAAVVVLAFLVSVFLIRETVQYAQAEGDDDDRDANLPFKEVVKRATYGDRTLFAAAQAGHIENFVDTLFWIAVPLYLLNQGLDIAAVGAVVGVHSAMYFLQIGTGGLADRIGRRPPVVAGMFLAGAGVLGMVLVEGYLAWAALAGVSGFGMALLYPNLMTVPSDAAHPTWRSAGMGVYRMWRDSGYAVGAILIGLAMEFVNAEAAFYLTAVLMFLSGAIVVVWMEETHPEFGTHEPPAPAPESPAEPAARE
ncbi:tetracyclin resistance protein [Halorubrum distributum JCM 9100]|uniref:Tetracyclin resistance protein n=3 Tax=Halorubrum distributum TaxID=29283 RepID=M0F4N8_9EURY|nr:MULTISPECIES: MFS transporter [Halorubrum distributum group]ELZ34326.1 tetracyclin resistance protein [Halorubrum terrestre JCM 10247]ELZ54157.1 tetracyclin resistance protein [Halorubrum distributum JCM 9100]ELZ54229.1 tetracyclin resistance protein [Halorubrum distributum JCM 10118]PHQ45597.1 MFS transporter [Halorubrum sp. C3]